jgi:hypothetical protein
VVEYPAHRGAAIANLATGRTATATSYEHNVFAGYPAANAIDGDLSTRWASDWSDNQALTVDLGASQPVARVVLTWEKAYATSYRIELSQDGTTWRTAAEATAGDGDSDTLTFPTTTARYVRMTGTHRATTYGYSLYDLAIYAY